MSMSPQVEEALEKLRLHRGLLERYKVKSEASLFGYQLKSSPYFDSDWGGVNMTLVEEDKDRVIDWVLDSVKPT